MTASMTLAFGLIVTLSAILPLDRATALSTEDRAKLEQSALDREINRTQLLETVKWLETLVKTTPKDIEAKAQLARFYFFDAVGDKDKDRRIEVYTKSISAADDTIKLEPKNLMANFWKAASLGKRGLDKGINRAFKDAPFMRDHLLVSLSIDEKYEAAGGLRAMGRLYYELPGWPFSFGSFEKAEENLKRAVDLAPSFIPNRIYYAQTLIKRGKKDEARKQLDEARKIPLSSKIKLESEEALALAKTFKL